MGKKLAAIAAAGLGVYLARREMRKNPQGTFARSVRTVMDNPTVVEYRAKTREKVSEKVREQGEIVTDKVAESVKERLFRPPVQEDDNTPEYVDVEVEEIIIEPPSK